VCLCIEPFFPCSFEVNGLLRVQVRLNPLSGKRHQEGHTCAGREQEQYDMNRHYISIAHAAFSSAQSDPDAVDITSFTRGIYALLSPSPTFWRVIGMTESALAVLRDNMGAKRLPKGLERAHIRSRADTIKVLLFGPPLSLAEFEQAVLGEADHTILCAKGENNNRLQDRDDIISFTNESDDPLFQPKGFAARWSDQEKALVRSFAE
jgi:hypothetical protein